jgi:hypothetical protein
MRHLRRITENAVALPIVVVIICADGMYRLIRAALGWPAGE